MRSNSRRRSAPTVYVAIYLWFGAAFAAFSIVSSIYRAVEGGLSPLQLVLVGTVLETSVFLAEVPTGIVADVYSRRLSVVIGYLMLGAGFVLEGAFAHVETILIAQVVWGVGYTFTSGAQDAWLADEVGEAEAAPVYLKAARAAQLGTLVGVAAGVGLATQSLAWPLVAGGLGMIALGVFLALVMPETGFRPTPREDRTTFGHMAHTFVQGTRAIRARPALITLMAIGLVYGLWSEGFDRLWEVHLLRNFDVPQPFGIDQLAWFGIISVAGMVLSMAALSLLSRRRDKANIPKTIRLLFLSDVGLLVSLVVLAAAGSFAIAVAAVLSLRLFRSMNGPLSMSWVNRGIDSSVRATVLSMRSQMDSLGQLLGGPAIGLVASAISLRAGIGAAAVALAPVLLLVLVAVRQEQAAERAKRLTP
ncbi:MAG TPA: MFS transporter [Tepidiformaceae bacterium]|nr:MFS transporter [Tepidiformaceae bacterium]